MSTRVSSFYYIYSGLKMNFEPSYTRQNVVYDQDQSRTGGMKTQFPTRFAARSGQLNWRAILNLDIRQIIIGGDIESLELLISNLIFSNVDLDHIREWSDPQIHQLIVLLQLSAEHLRNIVERVSESHESVQRKLQTLTERLEARTQELEQALEQNELLRRDLRQRRKMLTAYEVMVQAQKEAGGAGMATSALATMNGRPVVVKCGHCGKKFISQDHLDNHIARKHVEANLAAGESTGKGVNGVDLSSIIQEIQSTLRSQPQGQLSDFTSILDLLNEQRTANTRLMNRITTMEEGFSTQLQSALRDEREKMELAITRQFSDTNGSGQNIERSSSEASTSADSDERISGMKNQLSGIFTMVQTLENSLLKQDKEGTNKNSDFFQLADDVRFLCQEFRSLSSSTENESGLLQGLLRTLAMHRELSDNKDASLPLSHHDKIISEKNYEISRLRNEIDDQRRSHSEQIELLKSQLALSIQSQSAPQSDIQNFPQKTIPEVANTGVATPLQRSLSHSAHQQNGPPKYSQHTSPPSAPAVVNHSVAVNTADAATVSQRGDARIQAAIKVFSDFSNREFFKAATGPLPQPFKPTAADVTAALEGHPENANYTHQFYLQQMMQPAQSPTVNGQRNGKNIDNRINGLNRNTSDNKGNGFASNGNFNGNNAKNGLMRPHDQDMSANDRDVNNGHHLMNNQTGSVIMYDGINDLNNNNNRGILMNGMPEVILEHSVELGGSNNSVFLQQSLQMHNHMLQHSNEVNGNNPFADTTELIMRDLNATPLHPIRSSESNPSIVIHDNIQFAHQQQQHQQQMQLPNEEIPALASHKSTPSHPAILSNKQNKITPMVTTGIHADNGSGFKVQTAAKANERNTGNNIPSDPRISTPVANPQVLVIGNQAKTEHADFTPPTSPGARLVGNIHQEMPMQSGQFVHNNSNSSSKRSLPFVTQYGLNGGTAIQPSTTRHAGFDPMMIDNRRASLGQEHIRGALYDD